MYCDRREILFLYQSMVACYLHLQDDIFPHEKGNEGLTLHVYITSNQKKVTTYPFIMYQENYKINKLAGTLDPGVNNNHTPSNN